MRRRNAEKLIKAGAVVTIGTDNYWAAAPEFTRGGTKPDAQNHGIGSIIAIEGLVELGMTPAQAIVAATRNGAIASRGLDNFGTIEAGKLADLLVLDADPLRRHLATCANCDGDAKRPGDRSRFAAGHARAVAMKQPVVVPKLTPPAAGQPRVTAALPTDVVSEQAKRIVLFSGVSAFMWTFGLVMDALVLPATIGVERPTSGIILEAVSAVATLAVFLFLRFVHMTPHGKCGAGMWVLVLNAALITAFDIYNFAAKAPVIGLPSWTAVLILASAMIMPTTPRRTLIGSLIAASMGPIAMGILYLLGRPVLSPGVTFVLYLPNFIWAVIATLPAKMFQQMGRQIARSTGAWQL